MELTTSFETGGGKGIERLGDAHFAVQMRRDKHIYENYFHFRLSANGYDGEVAVDVLPDQDFLPQSRRILETHFAPATLWHSPQGPFTTDPGAWRPLPAHCVEWQRDRIRIRLWLEPGMETYVCSHHPITPGSWRSLLQERAKRRPELCRYLSAGETPDGHDLGCLQIGGGPRRVVIIAAEHPIETPASWAAWGIADYLTSELPEARGLLARFRFDILPHANPDGLARGNACFNASGVDLFQAYSGAARAEFAAEEARLLWRFVTATPVECLLDFHCFMGGSHQQDEPGEGIYMIPEFARILSPRASGVYRLINDRVIFATDAFSSRYCPSDLLDYSLCHQLALQHDTPSVFYEFNGAFSGPYRNTRNGIGVFLATMEGLTESGT